MKNFKLFIFSTIVLVASLFLASNVFAYQVGEEVGTYEGTSASGYQLNVKAVWNSYDIRWNEETLKWYNKNKSNNKSDYTWYTTNTYYAVKNGTKQPIYCIDKHAHAGQQNAQMVVQRVLDPTDPKDAVILKILSYGESKYGYFERVVALRAFSGFTSDFWDVQNEAACGNLNSGLLWAIEDKKSAAAVLGFSDASKVTADSLLAVNGVKNYRSGSTDKNVYYCRPNIHLSMCSESRCSTFKKAKELFLVALKYGAEVANGKVPDNKSVSYTKGEISSGNYQTIYENGTRMTVREITSTVTFEKFNDGKSDAVTIAVTPDTNGFATGVKYEYQVSGTDTWNQFNASTNFKPLLTKDKVVINIKVTAKAPADRAKATINYKVDVNYVDNEALSGALIRNSINPYPGTQRYYILEKTPNKHVPSENTISWVTMTCVDEDVPNKNDVTSYKDYIYRCCRGNNEAQFSVINECNKELAKATTEEERQNILKTNKYCILKAEYCDPCNTKVDVPKTCSEFSEGEFEKGKTATITGPEDIKVCVMDNEDEANNPYKLTKNVTVNGNSNYSFANNKYCKVSCKEDYKFDLPTGKYVISGRYFELMMGVSATKTCYTDMIDYQAFEKDLAEYTSRINSYIASGTATVLNTEFVKAYSDYRKAITDIEACSLGWDNSYTENPEISFDYDEEYIEKLLGGKTLKFTPAEDKKTTETKWFCNGSDVDRKYNECIGAKATTEAQTKTVTVKECTTTNATTYSCKDVQKQIPTTKYAKVSTKFEATYTPESIFFTKYSTGVIDINKDNDNKYTKLDKYLDSKIDESIKVRSGGLPVALKDGKGVYNYNIKFANVGEFFDQSGYGRILGDKSSVALSNSGTTFKGTYVCSYVVNCPECKVACKEDPARGIFCSLESTDKPQCVGSCAYDQGYGELYSIHQISVTNFNPTERTLGANLNTQKGDALIQSITEKGESIYNEPEYSFTFTPAAISFLRNEINANSENGFLGEASKYEMNCQLYSDIVAKKDAKAAQEIKGTDKDYTICQSTVLDELAKMNGVKAHSLADSRSKIESWLDSDYCKDKNNACVLVGNIGPAWK